MHERDSWLLFPLGANIFWLFASMVAGAQAFSHDGVSTLLVAGFSSTLALAGILGFIVNDIGPKKSFLVMLGQTVTLILIYALVYCHALSSQVDGFGGGLYYSVVTWIGRGHTEVVPTRGMLAVTAMQSFTGYVYLALLISLMSSLVIRARRN